MRNPILSLLLAAIGFASPMPAQDVKPSKNPARITGTVTDETGGTIPGATVSLESPPDTRKVTTDARGFFEFEALKAGTYTISITAQGFAAWTSPPIVAAPSQYVIVPESKLKPNEVHTTVSVNYSPEEVATEQVKAEEQQRVLGFIPNFYVVYDKNPEPMSTKLKFQLALKTSFDPVTIIGAGVLAGINQAGDTPDYRQGAKGYAVRYGAAAADGVSDVMLGGAILPSLLHQDPRYFYQGTGTNKSRAIHAIASVFVCRGDNGKTQPNYSSLGGDLASSALSNAYYPPANRGASLVFENLALSTSERMLSTLVQEFIMPKLSNKVRR